MFKLTSYKKIMLSRNILLIVLVCCFIAVGGKVILAHEKLNTYNTAIALFNKGELIAAEKQFRLAQLNVVVSDHNQDISEKLALLSPVKERIEEVDDDAMSASKEQDLETLIIHYNDFSEYKSKIIKGDNIQSEMLIEMLEHTRIEGDFITYFEAQKTLLFAELQEKLNTEEEKENFLALQSIPFAFFETEEKKKEIIHSTYYTYFASRADSAFQKSTFSESITEAKRQLKQLDKFSMDGTWLQKKFDSYLVQRLKDSVESNSYSQFAKEAKEVQSLKSQLNENSESIAYIDKALASIIGEAETLVANDEFDKAIKLFESLATLKDMKTSIEDAKAAWDLHQPIRVLKRMFPEVEFVNHINGRNNWGADSYIVAVSSKNNIYFGWLNHGEEMMVSTGEFFEDPQSDLNFASRLSIDGNPVIYFESNSSIRNKRYVAYDVSHSGIDKILDIEADGFTIESPTTLLVDNATGYGEGELSYYEKDDYYGSFEFSSIKVDYTDIMVGEIEQYKGVKVRFSTSLAYSDYESPLVELNSSYNHETFMVEYDYLLLDLGDEYLSNGSFYTFIGTFNHYTEIMIDDTIVKVPVFMVESFE